MQNTPHVAILRQGTGKGIGQAIGNGAVEGIVAGAAGGLAEIAWVSLYAGVTGGNPAILARGVTSAAGVTAFLPSSPVSVGICIHMALAVTLGVALALVWQKLRACRAAEIMGPYPFMLAALAGVWAVNFFVILPIVSPGFVHLVPYAVSLTSKLLFGLAVAAALQWQPLSAANARRLVPARRAVGTRRSTDH